MLTRLGRVLVRAQRSYSTRIGIVGVPLEEGQNKVGVANGPDAIRKGQPDRKDKVDS
jgi:arginase family enzyme